MSRVDVEPEHADWVLVADTDKDPDRVASWTAEQRAALRESARRIIAHANERGWPVFANEEEAERYRLLHLTTQDWQGTWSTPASGWEASRNSNWVGGAIRFRAVRMLALADG